MPLHFFSEDVKQPPLKVALTKKWLKSVCASESKKEGQINFIFCSDNYLLEMNKKYLDHNYFTDIITFDYSDKNIISGDIFISTERVEDNAQSLQNSFSNELMRVMVHGTLHLCGYKDDTESQKLIMRDKEDFYLSSLL